MASTRSQHLSYPRCPDTVQGHRIDAGKTTTGNPANLGILPQRLPTPQQESEGKNLRGSQAPEKLP
jgi:hypothetical protein